MKRHIERLDFAYWQLAATTRHKPARFAFKRIAIEMGLTEEQFEAWADQKEWNR